MATAAEAALPSLEDGRVQPCKEQKEEDSPIKAITKYFTPLGKNFDKVLSPPKSNNIMDYLKKKSFTNEKIMSPVTQKATKMNKSSLEISSRTLSKLKRRGRRCNLNNKLKETNTLEHDLMTEINICNNQELLHPKEACKPNVSHKDCEMLDFTVPAMYNLTTSEDCNKSPLVKANCLAEEGKMKVEGKIMNDNIKQSKKRKHKAETRWSEGFSAEIQQKSQFKKVEEKQIAHNSELENDTTVNILCSEAAACKTMELNDNTITVSFEDFLKSQNENKIDHLPELQTSDSSNAADETMSYQADEQLPFKKVTVLAQIHSVPPKSTRCRKIASIFLKQKSREPKRQSSLSALEEKAMEQISQKRKSNVVIPEEELELAVLETTGIQSVKSKCTAEEKYLFLKAFRQPESDTKNGGKKGSGKQKDMEEKATKHKVEEYETVSNKKLGNSLSSDFTDIDSYIDLDKCSTRIRNHKLRRKKAIMKTKRKGVITNKNQHGDANSQIPGAVLSVRQHMPQEKNEFRESPQQRDNEVGINTTPEKARISAVVSEQAPLQASTPKANKSFTKSDLYKAEVITELFDSKSPIRMKFTRIGANETFVRQNIKTSSIPNNISKAKKLVEKAKVLQQNKVTKKTDDTLHVPLRRSSRQLIFAEKKRLQNLQDSVVILDSSSDSVTTISKSTYKQKQILSLNDVLGKKTGTLKATKRPNAGKRQNNSALVIFQNYHPKQFLKIQGKEKTSSLIRKKVQKCAAEVITVFDDSSEQDSENSHDDEQFRAKRAFLMSGLPESLKRQMAKKIAALEAHSENSCFQKVIHIQQKDYDCSMWRLTPPLCPLLTKLREVNSEVPDVAKLSFSLGEFSILNTQYNITTPSSVPRFSGQRPAFSETQKKCLLEEIQSCNTSFAVKQFFDLLSVKQLGSENNKQVSKYDCLSSDTDRKSDRKDTKRKRKSKDHKSKRRKQVERTETALSGKNSEVPFIRESGVKNTISITDKDQREKSAIITAEDPEFGSEINSVSDFGNEDMLWTEKYQPQNSSELIGNAAAVKKLYRWLCEWRRRADLEENREEKERTSEHESSDCMDFKDYKSDSEEENVLCNTMLLTGPPGIGKTAAVYACAQELGFKIFEVNASCQRNGRQILSQLKEATQSHQVDKQGKNAHKPCFFNNYTTKSPRKNSPKKEWSPKKAPVSPKRIGLKQGLPPKTLASYFKIATKTTTKEEKPQRNNKGNKESLHGRKVQVESLQKKSEEDCSKKLATSLILFEEVDIIFDEDVGFLNAVKAFMNTTKRPIILTTNDPSFSCIFDDYIEEIFFNTPSLINVASYLQVVCLAENLRTDIRDFVTLLTANNCDIRQSILQLQFWVKSGGGYLKQIGQKEVNDTEQICTEETSSPNTSKPDCLVNLPKCEIGFMNNLFGLSNILPSQDLLSFLKHEVATKEEWSKLTHLLAEFQIKNIDLTYSNLPFILPLPVRIVSANPAHTTLAQNCLSKKCFDDDCCEEASPVKNKPKKRQRNITLLDDSDLFEKELDCSELITLPSELLRSPREEKTGRLESFKSNSVALTNAAPAKAKNSPLVSQCLNSLTEFVNNMSVLDYCFNRKIQQSKQLCKYEEFTWTKGKIKNGLSDKFSLDSSEDTDWWNTQNSNELKATMEALSFDKCFKNISKIMENNSERTLEMEECEGITLHISKEHTNLYFHESLADSSIQHNAQKRLEIINSVFSNTPLNFCNRQASIVEYLPVLRNICMSEKQKEQQKKQRTKRRFLHYLEGIHLHFPREIMNCLGTGFP